MRIAVPIVLAEIGNRLVIRHEAPRQPHHLDVAAGLTLEPPARLHPIEIAVDVELQQSRGMIRGPAGYLRLDALEPELAQIERIDERIDHANRIALVDPVIEAFGQQRRLPTIRPNHEALHQSPPQIARENHNTQDVFTQPELIAVGSGLSTSPSLGPKRIQLLRHLNPKTAVIAVLVNPKNPNAADAKIFEAAGRSIGIEVVIVDARREGP